MYYVTSQYKSYVLFSNKDLAISTANCIKGIVFLIVHGEILVVHSYTDVVTG